MKRNIKTNRAKKATVQGKNPTITQGEVYCRVYNAHVNGTIAHVWGRECDMYYENQPLCLYQSCTLFRFIKELEKLGCRAEKKDNYLYLYTTHTKYEWVCRVPLYGISPPDENDILYGYEWVPVRNNLYFRCEELNCAEGIDNDTPAELLANIKRFEQEEIKELKKTKKVA